MSLYYSFLIISLLASCYLANVLPQKIYYNLNNAERIFDDYVMQFNKQYNSMAEKQFRFEIFKEELKSINELNAKYPNTSFGLNQFSDITYEELLRGYTGLKMERIERTPYVAFGNAPASLDYRQSGYVTEVKDQGQCGSCYIFSAIGAIEGQQAMKHGQLISLSEQQGLDCGNTGCEGGQMEVVIQTLASQGGSVREEDYPYTGQKGTCRTDASKIVVKVSSGETLNIGEDGLKDALANYGPLSIGIHVCQEFKTYNGGIFYTNCPAQSDNGHAVLVVGYGNDGDDYWIIKNSWDSTWGESGYMRMARGKGLCGIGEYVVRAEVA